MKLQASLVAQFLCTIPLVSVETVLAWLKPSVPYTEQQQLCRQVTASYRLVVTKQRVKVCCCFDMPIRV
jgi:hypothetical protein